jgi:hypothetical protein
MLRLKVQDSEVPPSQQLVGSAIMAGKIRQEKGHFLLPTYLKWWRKI